MFPLNLNVLFTMLIWCQIEDKPIFKSIMAQFAPPHCVTSIYLLTTYSEFLHIKLYFM